MVWIPESGRSLGEGNGNSLRYSCLGNSMDSRAWGLRSLTCLSPSTRTTKFVGTSQPGPPPTSKPSLVTGGQTWNQTIQPAPKCYKNSQWKAACYLKHKIMGESETATKAPDFQATANSALFWDTFSLLWPAVQN